MDDHEAKARAALDRLTANEKECLRRRLQHQTAKEMALALGVSPHAVEKRLKMARLKLGVGSSLAAARLLAAAEGYCEPVSQPPDLPEATTAGQGEGAAPPGPRRWRWPPALLLAGAPPMILAALLALQTQAAQPRPSPLVPEKGETVITLPADAPGPHVAGQPAAERAEDITMRPAGPAEVTAFGHSSFRTMDEDHSGFIEQAEAPFAGVGIPAPGDDAHVQWFTGRRGRAMWIANMDTDGNGRVDEAEYVTWHDKIWRDHVPANWAWKR